jgi:hypothetical protein
MKTTVAEKTTRFGAQEARKTGRIRKRTSEVRGNLMSRVLDAWDFFFSFQWASNWYAKSIQVSHEKFTVFDHDLVSSRIAMC